MILPILTPFEEERFLLNFEGRPQKTQPIISNFFEGRSFNKVLYATFNSVNFMSNSKYLDFLFEMSFKPTSFDVFNKKFTFLISSSVYKLDTVCFVRKSFNKLFIEDFYLANKISKSSVVMNNSSKSLRQFSSNFNLFS